MRPGQRRQRHAQAAFVHVRFAAPPRAIVGLVVQHSAVVGCENHQRVCSQAGAIERFQNATDP